MTDEKVCFAQIDGHLDTNPKIRKAGSVYATAIFEFLLRRVAISRSNGVVPIRYIDPDYLADVLMMPCDEARHGTSRAVTAELIKIDETAGLVYIVGWSDEWGRRPKDGAARTASWREREKAKVPELPKSDVTKRDAKSSRVTSSDESDGSEEKRREEKREKRVEQPLDTLGYRETVDLFFARYQTAYQAKPTWGNEHGNNLKRLLKTHGAADVQRRIAILFDSPPAWLKPPHDFGTVVKHFDKLVMSADKANAAREPQRTLLDLSRRS